jgi:hypothetical protein
MKIGIDFDGVFTNLGLTDFSNYENGFLKSELSITVSKPNSDIEKILSFVINFCNIYIVTARPITHKKIIKKWLLDNQFNDYISDIICCGDNPKSKYIKQHNLILLIDDKLENVEPLGDKGYFYKGQPIVEMVISISKTLINAQAFFNKQVALRIKSVSKIGNLGASPTFLLEYENGTKHKLRICKDKQTFKQIYTLLNFANENNLNFISKKIFSIGFCIFKEYVEGISINSISEPERKKYIEECANCLVLFVSICKANNCQFSICSIDNFNVIITKNNKVMFIDLEASFQGSYIIDLIWAEKLLCNTEDEAKLFFDKFFSENSKLNNSEFLTQFNNYKTWLHQQLTDSYSYHRNNLKNKSEILQIVNRHWVDEEKLLLTLGFVQVGQTE